MAKRKKYRPGEQWHKSEDGVIRKCSASIRTCPKQHFDTPDEAASPRQRMSKHIDSSSVVNFSVVIGGGEAFISPFQNNLKSPSLRSASERARQLYSITGKRPEAPIGDVTINLPAGHRILLRRETFDLDGKIAARYYMRYIDVNNTYEESICDMNTRMEAELFHRRLQGYFTKAGEGTPDKTSQVKVMDMYNDTIKHVSEIEVMNCGAERVHRELGMGLFTKEFPGSYTLSSVYSNSSLQPYDVTEALKSLSFTDKEIHEISIHFSEEIPNSDGSRWMLDRLPDGDWYIGIKDKKGSMSEEVKTPAQASEIIHSAGIKYNLSEQKTREYSTFVTQMITEIDPAVKAYENNVLMRQKEKNQAQQIRKEAISTQNYYSNQPAKNTKNSHLKTGKEKIWGLFN